MPVAPRPAAAAHGLGNLMITAFVALAILASTYALHQDRQQQIQQQGIH